MPAVTYLIIIIFASVILVKAVSWFIKSVSRIAEHLGVSSYTISFLLVAIATSLPELIVGITSAVEKEPILSYANALGSNIALYTLVISIAIILSRGIHTRRIINSNDVYLSAMFSILAVSMAFNKIISRNEGIILIIGYIVYNIAFLKRSTGIERYFQKAKERHISKEILIFIVSLALLITSSEAIVQNAVKLSSVLNIELGFIGLTLIALGTSLPEIAFTVGLVKNRDHDEILGNIIGSVTANSTLVIGITALITPIVINENSITVSTFGFAVLSTMLFMGFSKSRKKLSLVEGAALLLVYIAFVAVEYYIQRPL